MVIDSTLLWLPLDRRVQIPAVVEEHLVLNQKFRIRGIVLLLLLSTCNDSSLLLENKENMSEENVSATSSNQRDKEKSSTSPLTNVEDLLIVHCIFTFCFR